MTNDELLQDLKQFIDAKLLNVATQDDLQGLATKQDLESLRGELKGDISVLRIEMNEKLDEVLNAVGTELKEQEDTLTRLKRAVGLK